MIWIILPLLKKMFLKKFNLFNPVQFIASFVIKTLVKRLDLPTTVFSFITVLYNISYSLIGTVGIFPVTRFLIDLSRFISTMGASQITLIGVNLQNFLTPRGHSPYLIQTVLPQIIPLLINCFPQSTGRSSKVFTSIGSAGLLFDYDFFILGFFTTILKPITKYILKICLGVLLSAIGVLWNESLTHLVYLKDFAVLIVDYFESLTDVKIPRFSFRDTTDTATLEPVDNIPYVEEYNKTSSLFSIIGLVLLGLAGAIGVIALSDYYAHDTVKNIPVVNTLADTIHVVWNIITNYFSIHKPDSGSTPDILSRSSSGDSSITITDNRTSATIPNSIRNMYNTTITPPATRSPSPYDPIETSVLNPFN